MISCRGWRRLGIYVPAREVPEMNRKLLGEYGDWFGTVALILGIALALHVVRGGKWTKAHNFLGGTSLVLFGLSQL
jgi:hypothetical protein